MPRILLTNHYSAEVLKVVEALVPEGFEFSSLPGATPEALLEAAPQADYFLASGRLRINAEVLAAATHLRMVQRTGVGTDGLDADTLRARQIPVYVNRGVNARSVAEHTLMLTLAALRKLPAVHARTRMGVWRKNETGLECHSLHGKRVGLVGLGNIGKLVAQMFRPFGVELCYHKPQRLSESGERELEVHYLDLAELLKTSDVVCLLCPLNEQTRNLINRETLAMMKPGSLLVNTARGPIVNLSDLSDALHSGHLAGAALDVFEQEPISKDAPILSAPNTILTPHVGGLTIETFSTMISDAFRNIALFHQGQTHQIASSRWI